MIVSEENFSSVLYELKKKTILALDTETTGLRSFHGDELFSIIIADERNEYYFNFNSRNRTDQQAGVVPLPRLLIKDFQDLFDYPDKTWVLANAKFDMHMMAKEGLTIHGNIWDVLVMARLERNDHLRYSLEACADRIGSAKSKVVDEYIKKHKHFVREKIPGKKGERKNPQFWKVPLSIIYEYGCKDARVTYELFFHQVKAFKAWNESRDSDVLPIDAVIKNEMELTKACFEAERRGMLLNKEYVDRALQHELALAEKARNDFFTHTGYQLVDSNKGLFEILGKLGVEPERTEKGNVSYTEKILSKSNHPAAVAVLAYRNANKRASSYYSSFLYHADESDLVHCNIRQSATLTGRFSISDPALQTLNVDDEEGSEWSVRRSFRPARDCILVAIDYKAFEFRAMLDTAEEKELAHAIEKGLDPHQATADLVGISRKQAKTLNFGLLYGMGAGKLADALGCSVDEAKEIKSKYFDRLPKIKNLIYSASHRAREYQVVVNRFGRPYFYPNSAFSYKALNALIQGGTADAVKFAMVQINNYLKGTKSGILLQIHDEILFEIHKDELHLIPRIQKIMEDAWPEKFHKMECSVEYSEKSWGDMEEWRGSETGDKISQASNGSPEDAPQGKVFLDSAVGDSGDTRSINCGGQILCGVGT